MANKIIIINYLALKKSTSAIKNKNKSSLINLKKKKNSINGKKPITSMAKHFHGKARSHIFLPTKQDHEKKSIKNIRPTQTSNPTKPKKMKLSR
jgi:hypothetical protein